MIPPEARARLAEKMEERRLELRLTWREVAEAGGISYEVIRNLRNGRGTGIAALTEGGIETGLRWEPGSVQLALEGGEPVPLDDEDDLNATPEMRAAMAPHVEEVRGRVAVVRGLNPVTMADGRPVLPKLPGTTLFPEPENSMYAATWDALTEIGYKQSAVVRLVAVAMTWDAEEAEMHRNDGIASGLLRS